MFLFLSNYGNVIYFQCKVYCIFVVFLLTDLVIINNIIVIANVKCCKIGVALILSKSLVNYIFFINTSRMKCYFWVTSLVCLQCSSLLILKLSSIVIYPF